MGIVVKPYTFSAGTKIVASEHNSNYDTIYNEFNGSIDNDNIDASAAIADTKLAQITTPDKVSGAALAALANISTASGQVPTYALATGTTSTSVFLRGDGTWQPASTVDAIPYLGATTDANIGVYTMIADTFIATSTGSSDFYSDVTIKAGYKLTLDGA